MDNTSGRRVSAFRHAHPSQHAGSSRVIDLTEDDKTTLTSINNIHSTKASGLRPYSTENNPPNSVSGQRQDLQPTQPTLTTRISHSQLNNNGKRGRDDHDTAEDNGHSHKRLSWNEQSFPNQLRRYSATVLNAQALQQQEYNPPTEPTDGDIPVFLGSRILESQELTRRVSDQTVLSNNPSVIESIYDTDSQPDVLVTAKRRVKKKIVLPSIIDHSKRRLLTANHNGIICQPGKSVELQDGTFMRVKAIYEDEPDSLMLVGTVFTRIERFRPIPTRRFATEWAYNPENLPDTRFETHLKGCRLINELIQRVLARDGEDKDDFGLWRRPIYHVIRGITLNLIDSNDEDSFLYEEGTNLGSVIYDDLWFTCRWREVCLHDETGAWKEQSIERLPRKDLDEPQHIPAQGSYSQNPSITTPYTFIDAFCSAGGVSVGAQKAGLDIKYAFDKDENKMATYMVNFGDLNGGARAIGVDEFIRYARKKGIHADVLHLSPPCQPFSQANSTPNEQKNEMNQPPLFACSELIKILEPRVVTVEEAPGIRMRHAPWFNALIWQFTSLGYSLRWKQISCADFGVPQTRKRLMIIAAAHGEDLPLFPEPTHIPGACSIQQTLRELERYTRSTGVTYHRPQTTRVLQPKPVYDANRLANTITTSGGCNYHPSGLRDFTIREYASLQTFPFQFGFGTRRDLQEFSLQELKTQIGNAVPPAMAMSIYRTIIKSLLKSDERALTLRRARNHDGVIAL